MKVFSLLSFFFFVFSSVRGINFHESLRTQYKTFSLDDVLSVFQRSGVAIKVEKAKVFERPFSIYHEENLHLMLPYKSISPHHVVILIEKKYLDMSSKELILLEKLRSRVGLTFKKLGYPHYVYILRTKYNWFGKNYFALELIPRKLEGKDLDTLDAMKRYNVYRYDVYQDNAVTQTDRVKIEKEREEFNLLFQKTFSYLPQKTITKRTLPWKRKFRNREKLQEVILEQIKKDMIDKGLFFEEGELDFTVKNSESDGKDRGGEFTQQTEKSAAISRCAFCQKNIIEKQAARILGKFAVMYNLMPHSPFYHFLVTPTHHYHVEYWDNFSEQDLIEFHNAIRKTYTALKEYSQSEDIVMYLQNGIAAGMSVPHTHMHVMLRPSSLHFHSEIFLELTNSKFLGVSKEEMGRVNSEFRKFLKE